MRPAIRTALQQAIVVIGVVSGIVGIIAFVSGKASLADLFSRPDADQPKQQRTLSPPNRITEPPSPEIHGIRSTANADTEELPFTFPMEKSVATVTHGRKNYECFDTFAKNAAILLCPDGIRADLSGTVFRFVTVQRDKFAELPAVLTLEPYDMYFVNHVGARRQASFGNKYLSLSAGEHGQLELKTLLTKEDIAQSPAKTFRLYVRPDGRSVRTPWIIVKIARDST